MQGKEHHEYLIIGAGPAGLQLGYYMERDKKDYLILEAGEKAGTFFEMFPRHRKLISINKVYTGVECPEMNLRWDWNSLLCDDNDLLFKSYTESYFPHPSDLINYLNDYATKFAIKVKYGTKVKNITKDQRFELQDEQGNAYSCDKLIVAAGLTRPYIPDIPGIEYGESYFDFSVDPKEFTNKRVLIIGKGNSAFETADNLTETTASIQMISPHPVRLAWKTHYVGHLRAVNNNFLDTYQLKSQNTILDAYLEKIEPHGDQYKVSILYTHAKGERREILFDRILICAGFRFNDSMFDDSCKPTLCYNRKFPQLTCEWESTNIKDLYFAGNLMHSRDFRKTMSGFIHGFRYNVKALSQILECRNKDEAWPSYEIPLNASDITDHVIRRINKSSAMFLQPAFFCDVLTISKKDGQARYYDDMPVDYALEKEFCEDHWYYTISLEYGDFHTPPDPFNIERDPDPVVAHLTAYLHPIIRRFSGMSLNREHHVPEDLENVYDADKYTEPMVEFFKNELSGGTPAASVMRQSVEMVGD
jgi:thioredoxin reductase